MANEISNIGLFIGLVYSGLWFITALLTYIRAYRLRVSYRQLLMPLHQPIEQISSSSLSDTQEMKPVLRRVVSQDITLHIQPDAELEARTQAEISRHKGNLKRIIDHISSTPLAS
ncbi:MAG: hypothetical protein SH821_04980 [Phototrophicales bacterium]|mgnify:CR=1 FL=1|nr:hypothetical protein [Phototrophicales bacterium]